MTEPLLPRFASGADPGSSFSDLLRASMPQALSWANLDPAAAAGQFEVTHATTVVSIRYDGGVVLAGDRRATEGHSIASRRIQKVYPGDRFCGVAIAGAAGPAMEMVHLFQTELEHYEKVEGIALSLEGKANKLGQMVRANLPAAMQGLGVIPLFCGYDLGREQGRIFRYDMTGGRYEEVDFHSTGSGGVHARNWIKASWRADMGANDAVSLALNALFQAADEDSATGGPDLVRGIYPSIATIDAEGFRAMDDPSVEALARTLLGETSP